MNPIRALFLAALLSTGAAALAVPESIPTERAAFKEHVRALHKRAAEGDYTANDALAALKRRGLGAPGDYLNVYALEKQYAERPTPGLCERIGIAYIEGAGGHDRDPQRAVDWWQRGAELNDTGSLFSLGRVLALGELLKPGDRVKIDRAAGARYLERASERGDSRSAYRLSLLAEEERDISAMVGYLQRAVEMRNGPAAVKLGLLHLHGEGVAADPAKALRLFEEAAKDGYGPGNVEAGRLLLVGAPGLERDRVRAAAAFKRALRSPSAVVRQRLREVFDPELDNLALRGAQRALHLRKGLAGTALLAELERAAAEVPEARDLVTLVRHEREAAVAARIGRRPADQPGREPAKHSSESN
jgi:TPR repeat protein